MKKLSTEEKLELGINTSVMAMREYLMSYFKGSCVREVSATINLSWSYIDRDDRSNHQYRRREHELANPMRLLFYNVPLLEVHKHPNTVTFYPAVLSRSPEYQEIDTRLKTFFGKYLSGVELKENNTRGRRVNSDGTGDNQQMLDLAKRYTAQEGVPDDVPEPNKLHLAQMTYAQLVEFYRGGSQEMPETSQERIDQLVNARLTEDPRNMFYFTNPPTRLSSSRQVNIGYDWSI